MISRNEERRGCPHTPAVQKQMSTRLARHRAPQYVGRCVRRQADEPQTFGLSEQELWAEAARLVCDYGWDIVEVKQVLALPEAVNR